MTSRRHLAAPFVPVAALLLAACASRSAPVAPASPAADSSPSQADALGLSDLEGQIAALGAAEDQITRAIHRPPPGGNGVGPGADRDQKKVDEQEHARFPPPFATASPASPPAMKSGAAAGQGSYRASDDGVAGADPCLTACSALSSMGRAARHLCELTGDGDARCDSARSRVSGATERVMSSCPACAPEN